MSDNPMKWLARASTWWRARTPVPEFHVSVAPPPRPTPLVPTEYLALHVYLEHRHASTVFLSFEQMESLLGFSLPDPARIEPGWWSDTPSGADRHTATWTVARRTAIPNLSARTVAFERLEGV